jgi:hypothetical protein
MGIFKRGCTLDNSRYLDLVSRIMRKSHLGVHVDWGYIGCFDVTLMQEIASLFLLNTFLQVLSCLENTLCAMASSLVSRDSMVA